jgi:hypothetical protein
VHSLTARQPEGKKKGVVFEDPGDIKIGRTNISGADLIGKVFLFDRMQKKGDKQLAALQVLEPFGEVREGVKFHIPIKCICKVD